MKQFTVILNVDGRRVRTTNIPSFTKSTDTQESLVQEAMDYLKANGAKRVRVQGEQG